MSDEMSAEAKERAFRKPRSFNAEQTEWFALLEQIGTDVLPHERLVGEAYQAILIHLKVEREELMRLMRAFRKGEKDPDPVLRVQLFQNLLHKIRVFRGDEILKQKVRELAQSQGLTTEQILTALRRL